MKTKIFSSFFFAGALLMILPSIASAQYWQDPGVAPTGSNAAAPINVSSLQQEKSGSLIIDGGLSVDNYSSLITTYGSNVGIGFDPTAGLPPSDALDVDGNIVASPAVDGGSAVGNITAAGSMYAGAFYYQSSDERLKENIAPLQNSLSTIEQLQGVSFDWKKNQEPAIGFIAQDVQKILPQIVSTDSNGYEAVSYTSVIPILVEAVKEQQAEIDALTKEVNDLKNN